MADLKSQLKRRKSSNTRLIVGVAVGVVVVGGLLAFAFAGGGGGGGATQDVPLIRPGYKVLPNCGGIEVMDEARALNYARETATKAAANFKDVSVTLFGPVCAGLPADRYIALAKKHGVFLYRIQRAVLQGALAATPPQINEAAAEALLAAARNELASIGVDMATLTPVQVVDTIQAEG